MHLHAIWLSGCTPARLAQGRRQEAATMHPSSDTCAIQVQPWLWLWAQVGGSHSLRGLQADLLGPGPPSSVADHVPFAQKSPPPAPVQSSQGPA